MPHEPGAVRPASTILLLRKGETDPIDVFMMVRHYQIEFASGALVFPGTGTLANDAVAGQISLFGRAGLVISNGEFGERLTDHARRWRLP
ncbi:MAG: hypothetical protein NT113_25875, partial [Hyphomicrobiales bacterium]|nr:hypothetical protein [Hyphomicrobiales bacterium]